MSCDRTPVAITARAQVASAITSLVQVAVAIDCCSPKSFDAAYVSWLPIDEEIKSSLKPWNGASFVGPENVSRGGIVTGGGTDFNSTKTGAAPPVQPPVEGGGGGISHD